MKRRIVAVAALGALVLGLLASAHLQAHAAPAFTWGMEDAAYPPDMSNITTLGNQLGRQPQIVHWYREFTESCSQDAALIQQQEQAGRNPMITWETYDGSNNAGTPAQFPLKAIAAGQFDSQIDACASAWKAGGASLYIRIDQEMNDPASNGGGGYPWTVVPGNQFGNAPGDYAAMYQHMVARLRADGVQAKFIWNSDGDITNHPIPAGTYPGDGSVDFIGFDYYDFSKTPYQKDYDLITQQSATRPVLVGEMGASKSASTYVDDLTNALTAGSAPRTYGAVWFNEDGTALSSGSATFNSVKNLLASTTPGGPAPTPTPTPTATPTATPTPTPSPSPTTCAQGGNSLKATGTQDNLGGVATSSPAAVSWDKSAAMNVFVRGSDGQMWDTWKDTSGYAPWNPKGGSLLAGTSPALASWAAGRLDLFWVGTDHQLWHRWYGGSWSGDEALGGYLTSSASAVSWGPGRIDILARGSDNGAWHMDWNGSSWDGWSPVGGGLSGAPALDSQGPGVLDAFVQAGGGIWQDWFNGSSWSGWYPINGGPMSGDAAAVSCAPGHVEVTGTGSDGNTHSLAYANGWGGWNPLTSGANPGLATENGYDDVFTVGASGNVLHQQAGALS